MADRILVVDDDVAIHELLHLFLEAEGFEVSSAMTGGEAIELARSDAPDLVVLDLTLPDADGTDVCAAIRQARDVPVLVFTGRNSAADREACDAAGASDYVVKSGGPAELVRHIHALLAG
jgi:two-component system response regulator ResD